jgi:hypothetical protein
MILHSVSLGFFFAKHCRERLIQAVLVIEVLMISELKRLIFMDKPLFLWNSFIVTCGITPFKKITLL